MRNRRRSNKNRVTKSILLVLSIGALMSFFFYQFNDKRPNLNPKPQILVSSAPKSPSSTPLSVDKQGNDPLLDQAVMSSLVGTSGTYAVYIKNLKNNEMFSLNVHSQFQTGSLYKLWIMAESFDQIQSGTLDPDEVLSGDVGDLNNEFDIASEDADLQEGTITLSVNDALTQMITISHNYAALLLTEKIKLSNVAKFLQENQFNESKVGINGDAPTSTAADIGLFLEKLYNGKLANPAYTTQMLDLLKAQQLNNKLPVDLPNNVVIAHKTGELDDFSHDAGIVYTPKGDYIIVVLSESDNPDAANDRISAISKAVYDYFEQ